MKFGIKNNNIIFIFLISVKFILTQYQKCRTIMNCVKCPMPNICQLCENGYILKADLTQCLIQNNNMNNNLPLNSQNNNLNGNIAANSSNNNGENNTQSYGNNTVTNPIYSSNN